MSKLGEKQRTSLRTSEIALHFFYKKSTSDSRAWRSILVYASEVWRFALVPTASQGGYGRGYTMGIYWAIPAVGDTFMFLDLAWRLHYRLYENMDCVSGYTDRNSRCASLDSRWALRDCGISPIKLNQVAVIKARRRLAHVCISCFLSGGSRWS